jgi:acyl-[acyl-carrier-protein]-phospholipid O-acyltransferase / long-chain-fatty-acid--[acyl-carrier-protein] ligase
MASLTTSSVQTSDALDALTALPGPNKSSVVSVLTVQLLNAFGDNLVKMLLVALALAVAKGTELGDNMQVYLGIIFSLPYVLFAPLAGYLSDRYSKRSVILWTQVAQLLCYAGFVWAVQLQDAKVTLWSALVLFFILAVQATLLSPAKSGVMKELAGSRRLGTVNGLLQMAMMAGILAGIGAAGPLFAYLVDVKHYTPWDAVLLPLYGCMALAVVQILAGWMMLKTPEHPEMQAGAGMWFSHFQSLDTAFKNAAVGRAVMGTTFFWFISYGLGSILVSVGKEAYPDMATKATEYASMLSGTLGATVMLGGLLGGLACRRRVELGIVPLAGIGMASCMISTLCVAAGSSWMLAAMAGVGLFGGVFLVPLTTFMQDKSQESERARVLSAANLLDCLIGGVGANLVVRVLDKLGLTASQQIAAFGLAMLLGSLWICRFVAADLVRFLTLGLIRMVYRVRGFHTDIVPKEGPVLLLPNHVSYVDALVLSAAVERPIRFVIWDELYHRKAIHWFVSLFGCVPISATRAKDAIRTVAEALKAGEAVCLFPEGELTRSGKMNPLQKGFELIIRTAPAPVLPVYLSGLWGSIFSWSEGKVFSKWPKKLRYPVQVHCGPLLPAAEANTARVTQELHGMRDRFEKEYGA